MTAQTTLPKYEDMQPTFARHREEIEWIGNNITKTNLSAYKHGMTQDEIERIHKILIKKGKFPKVFKTYKNRIRECYYLTKKMGKHYVHGEIHYFSMQLHLEGVIDHSRCVNCQLPNKEAGLK